MASFPYTNVPGKLRGLLDKIRTVGRPPKVTVQWLKTLGFRSSNDVSLIGVLKFINFIDSSGVPTERWTQYRGAHYKKELGDAIRHGYAELYAVYPDAHVRSPTELEHVFSTSSSSGKQVIARSVATFRALAEDAEFSQAGAAEPHMETGPLHTPVATQPVSPQSPSGPALHIDIQIHISPEASPAQIDQIFASMGKHLYGRRGGAE